MRVSFLPPVLALLFIAFWSAWDLRLGIPGVALPSALLLVLVILGFLRSKKGVVA